MNRRALEIIADRCAAGLARGEKGAEKLALISAACEVMEIMGLDFGASASRAELRRLYLKALLCLLLSESNALYCYPYTDGELDKSVLPVWARVFANLEGAGELVKAFSAWHEGGRFFPRPAQIKALMSPGAFALQCQPGEKPREEIFTPGCGRRHYEEFKRKRAGADDAQCRLFPFQPLAESARLS